MHETTYKIWAWGEPTGDGSNRQFNVAIRAKAKRSTSNPFEIANELLCMRLGLALRLPIPAGVLLDKDGDTYYASLHLAMAGENLPPAIDEDIEAILRDEWLTCGIICFDSWILNEDRWAANIAYDEVTRQVQVFDHGRAFLGRGGRAELEEYRTRLCINSDNHCLAEEVKSLTDFDDWHARIKDIPEYFIRESVNQASLVGLPVEHCGFCADFLLDRRDRLKELFIHEGRAAFPKYERGLFDPLSKPVEPDFCI